jgi:hypothetical protein
MSPNRVASVARMDRAFVLSALTVRWWKFAANYSVPAATRFAKPAAKADGHHEDRKFDHNDRGGRECEHALVAGVRRHVLDDADGKC